MRILVCGGRDYNDKEVIRETLVALKQMYPDAMLIHGGAPGADAMAGWIGGTIGFDIEVHVAQWAKYGKAAGPLRNQEMLDSGIDLVVAFPGGRGTADMVERARLAGVPIKMVDTISVADVAEFGVDVLGRDRHSGDANQAGGVPSFDPLDPTMSGDNVDPALVQQELTKVYSALRKMYADAISSADPVGRVALGVCCDAISRLQLEWFDKIKPMDL
jgi:hypothetical protein